MLLMITMSCLVQQFVFDKYTQYNWRTYYEQQ